jgi:hypothetical protein
MNATSAVNADINIHHTDEKNGLTVFTSTSGVRALSFLLPVPPPNELNNPCSPRNAQN